MENPTIFDRQTDRQTDIRLFINVLRGIAIFLMLWGHCIQCCCLGEFDFFENRIFRVIYSFHMPLFMLISGYLFFFSLKKRNLKELLEHRTQSMLQPIIMCGILCFLLWDVVVAVLNGYYGTIFGGEWLSHLTDYWFLWSVLSASIVVGIACKVTNKKWVSAIILVLGVLFVYMMPCAEMNVYMYPYFVIGFLFSATKDTHLIYMLSRVKYICLVLFPIMMFYYRKEHYIYTSGLFGDEGLIKHMPINMYRWTIGLIGSIFVIVLLELAFGFVGEKLITCSVTGFFEDLGKNSLQVYILSSIFLSRYLPVVYRKAVNILGQNILAKNIILYDIVWMLILAVAYSIVLLFIIHILEKTKINKILFGK